MTSIKVVTVVLSLFFLFASSIKILGWQQKIFQLQLAMFIKYGLNRQLMALVGFIEFFGAVAIWFHNSPMGALGALAIMGTSMGAIGFHLKFDTWKDGIPSMITLALSAFLAWNIRNPLLELLA